MNSLDQFDVPSDIDSFAQYNAYEVLTNLDDIDAATTNQTFCGTNAAMTDILIRSTNYDEHYDEQSVDIECFDSFDSFACFFVLLVLSLIACYLLSKLSHKGNKKREREDGHVFHCM